LTVGSVKTEKAFCFASNVMFMLQTMVHACCGAANVLQNSIATFSHVCNKCSEMGLEQTATDFS
jgi:hypothetical protein